MTTRSRRSPVPWLFFFAGLIGVAAIAVVVTRGWTYYALPAIERPGHMHHDRWRPSGSVGLLFGVAGTVFMVLNLTYLLRKRLGVARWLGDLRSWMAFHVFTGIVGPGMILVHSAFQLSSPLASLAFVSMLVVVVAGILGRFIYAAVPRSIEGHEIEFHEVRRLLDATLERLARFGVDSRLLDLVREDAGEAGVSRGLVSALRALVVGEFRMRREYRRLRRQILGSPSLRVVADGALPLAREVCRQWRWLGRYHQLRDLMGTWRFLHRWLAIVLMVTVLFHVGLALRYGALWILGGDPP